MMTEASVTVVIVNWNGGDLLDQCLRHLLRQSRSPRRILIMDNGSTDGSADRIRDTAEVDVQFVGANLGFARANNLALKECDTDFVALLNPDAFPDRDWLENLLHAARTHPDVAAFGSRQMVHGTENTLDGIGDVYHFSGLIWRDGHGRPHSEADDVDGEIFSPCAGAALYRRDALLEVGGFDEDYFCYVEDVDLGFRLRLAGYKSMYVADAVVYHVGSACSGGQHSDFAVYYGHRNLVWAFVKNMPGTLFWILLPVHLLLNVVTLIHFTLHGQGAVMLRAKRDALKGIPSAWRKRRGVQAQRRASVRDIWRVLDKRLIPSRRLSRDHLLKVLGLV
ncbi:MAG: glycosyltransferase family 2 protein [Burkholderiaceae bacterium]|nr:glycosyltransferase family 2 protein [Gammaproteobacteria bacterium]